MQDDINVHRFVFAHRTYGLAEPARARTMPTRSCGSASASASITSRAASTNKHPESPIRALMPKLLDQYKLAGKTLGTRDPGDAAVDELARTIYNGPPERSAEAVAAALAEGISPEVVGEAISLASNLLVLRQGPDQWRTHGDSAGVHSSDATNAWRNMARIAEPQHAVSRPDRRGLSRRRPTRRSQTDAYPTAEHRAAIKATDAEGLLAEAEDAIRHNDQGRAAAAIAIYGEKRPLARSRVSSGCSSTRSAKTAACTARSTSTPCRKNTARRGRRSAGGRSSAWPASPPAPTATTAKTSTAAAPPATKKPAGC